VSTTTATVQYIDKNAVTFLFTILCTVLTTRIKYSTLILMCIGEPLVWMTPYFYCKKFSSDKRATTIY